MPLYSYKCSRCGLEIEEVRKMSEHALEKACSCGGIFKQTLSLANVSGDIEPYLDENLGEEPIFVKSKSHRRELMRERGLEEAHQHRFHDPAWKKHRVERRRFREEQMRRMRNE